MDVARSTHFLRKAEERHSEYVADARHRWSDRCAAFIVAGGHDGPRVQAADGAGQHMGSLP